MSCKKFENLLALYVEDDLPLNRQRIVHNHLAACPACQDTLEELRDSQSRLKLLMHDVLEDSTLLAVKQQVMTSINEQPRWHRREISIFAPGFAVGSAALVAAMAFVLWALTQWQTPRRPVQHVDAGRITVDPVHGLLPSAPETVVAKKVSPPNFKLKPRRRAVSPRKAPRNPELIRSSQAAQVNQAKQHYAAADPVVMKILTDDPNVVIYWLLDPHNGGKP